ncbi:amino acid ABC transporter permease, partial [Mangrovicoccus sp. HB182678]|nr:amino acid ABC transporter permease [Mangrovicoccus algicola]
MIPPSPPPPPQRRLPLADLAVLAGLLLLAGLAAANVLSNMQRSGMTPGFGFLGSQAGFDVSETLLRYSPQDSYARVVLAGVLNTLLLAAVSLVLATLAGLAVGLASVGPSRVGARLALLYVELLRNLPKLLILLVLFVAAVTGLPHVREALSLGPVHLSNRSLHFPLPVWDPAHALPLWAALAALPLARAVAGRLRLRRDRT